MVKGWISYMSISSKFGRTVLVTGASSGIGKSIALALASDGFTVYGTSRRDFELEGVKMIKADVRSTESVENAFSQIDGDVSILINCAGTGLTGAVEDCTGEDALEQMNTNYAGALRTVRCALPAMRRNGRGLIINIGSVGGIYVCPFQSLYSSSKAALEKMTESLRIEAAPFGVKACTVCPGDLHTGFTANRLYTHASKNTDYGEAFSNSVARMERDETNGKPPVVVTKAVLRIIKTGRVPVRITVGADYKLLVFLKRLFPLCVVEKILTAMYPKHNQKN